MTPSLRVSRYAPRFCPQFQHLDDHFALQIWPVYHLLGPISKAPHFQHVDNLFVPLELTKSIILRHTPTDFQSECMWCMWWGTVYPRKYAHGFVVLCFVVVMQSFIMNSHEVFIHIHQGCFAGTGAIVRLPQCQWSKPDGYGKISQCITTTKHSKAKTVCIFLGI